MEQGIDSVRVTSVQHAFKRSDFLNGRLKHRFHRHLYWLDAKCADQEELELQSIWPSKIN